MLSICSWVDPIAISCSVSFWAPPAASVKAPTSPDLKLSASFCDFWNQPISVPKISKPNNSAIDTKANTQLKALNNLVAIVPRRRKPLPSIVTLAFKILVLVVVLVNAVVNAVCMANASCLATPCNLSPTFSISLSSWALIAVSWSKPILENSWFLNCCLKAASLEDTSLGILFCEKEPVLSKVVTPDASVVFGNNPFLATTEALNAASVAASCV